MTEHIAGITSTTTITRQQVRDAVARATGLVLDERAMDYLKPARAILRGAVATDHDEGIRQVVERAFRQALARAGCPHRINLARLHLLTSHYGWPFVHSAIAGGVAVHPDMARLCAVLEHYQQTGELPDSLPDAGHQARSAA